MIDIDSLNSKDFVLTSGGFDPLHIGHIKFLEWAHDLGFPVVVAVNSSDYISQKHIPMQSTVDRVSILNSLKFVDLAFELPMEKSVSDVIRENKPKFFVKGLEYQRNLPKDEVLACMESKTEIVFAPTEKISSSEILRAFKEKTLDSELGTLESNILSSVATLSSQEEYTENYFFDSWRDGGHTYDIETRRRIEGKHPEILLKVFGSLNTFLDVGCGNGALMLFLKELGLEVDGLDISEDAKKNAPKSISDRIQILDLTSYVEVSKTYNLVICREVLEHIPFIHYLTFVTNLCRLSNRYVYITTRFAKNPDTLWDIQTEFEADPTHITLPSITLLRSIMSMNGFRRVESLEQEIDWMHKQRVLVYERI
jgi:cytidyltransferase-like protein